MGHHIVGIQVLPNEKTEQLSQFPEAEHPRPHDSELLVQHLRAGIDGSQVPLPRKGDAPLDADAIQGVVSGVGATETVRSSLRSLPFSHLPDDIHGILI